MRGSRAGRGSATLRANPCTGCQGSCATIDGMTTGTNRATAVPWVTFTAEAPALAAAVEARLRATKHRVLATLRADGSPRVSGTEVDFWDGDLVLGSMFGAVKARDLLRDGRFAVHANPGD